MYLYAYYFVCLQNIIEELNPIEDRLKELTCKGNTFMEENSDLNEVQELSGKLQTQYQNVTEALQVDGGLAHFK